MKAKPTGALLMMRAGRVNRHRQDVVMYLKEENKVLRERPGARRARHPSLQGRFRE